MPNTYAATLAALSPNHNWALDETSGLFVDSGVTGGIDCAEQAAGGVWRQAPGPIRGTPREYAMWGDLTAGSTLQSSSAALTAVGFTTGTFLAVVDVYSLAVENIWPITQVYANNSAVWVGLKMEPNGSVHFRCFNGGVSNSGFSSVGVITEGSKHLIGGIQRDDGNGMRVFIDGVDVTNSQSQTGGATLDDFVDAIIGAQTATDFSIGGLNISGSGGAIIQRPSIWRNTALSDADMLALFNAINGFDQTPSDWFEKVFDLADGSNLNYWFTGYTGSAGRIAGYVTGADDVDMPLGSSTGTAPNIENVLDTDIVTAFNARKQHFGTPPNARYTVPTGALIGGADTLGTVNIVARITSIGIGVQKNMVSFGDSSADRFEVSIVGSAFGYQMLFRMEINTGDFVQALGDSFFLTLPQYMMFTVVQDGTGYLLYINGSIETFIETGGGGAITDASWLAAIAASASGDTLNFSAVPGTSSTENFEPNDLALIFILRKALTGTEVSELYDALRGIFPPAVAFGDYASELQNTGNQAEPEGPGPDWWWRMNAAAGVILDIGIARARAVSPINADAIVEGGDPLHSVNGPLPEDGGNAAIYFDGSGDYYEIGVNGVRGQLANTATGSIGCFFSRNALEDENIFYAQSNDAGTAFWRWGINETVVELIVQTSAGNRVTFTSNKRLSDARFFYLVLTCDGSNYKFFLNGGEDASAAVVVEGTGAEGDWFDALVADNSAVASRADAGFFTETTGRISELFIYDGEVLGPAEIAALYEAAIVDGILGSPPPGGLVVFENVTFKNGAKSDIRAQNAQPGTFQQVVRGNRCKFIGGMQGDAVAAAQSVLLEGPVHATFRGCEADLQATPTFGRGGIVGTAIDTTLAPTQDGSIIVSDCDFDRMGFLDGASFLSPVMCLAAFGMSVEDSRFKNSLGTAVGWRADAQRVSVINNQIEGTTQAGLMGSILSAQGLNTRLGNAWLIRGNKITDTNGRAISLNGANSAGSFARNIAIQNNESDNNPTSASIRVNQVGDVLIEGNKGNVCSNGIRLVEVQGSIVVRRNDITNHSLVAYFSDAATLNLADVTIDGNKADGAGVGDGLSITQVRRLNVINNKLLDMVSGVSFGEIAVEGVFAGNRVEATTPFEIQAGTTQVGFQVGQNFIADLGTATAIVVSSATIDVIANYHSITAAANIDLETIDGPLIDGYLLVLRRGLFSAGDITLKDGVDNLNLAGDFILATDNDQCWLVRQGADWNELSRVEVV